MGGLKKIMPVTFFTAWIGTLALIGFPGFSGYYSKDAIISAVGHIERAGAGFAELLLVAGVLVTALYSFRLMFLTFHGAPRMDDEAREHAHESPWVVTVPLVLLAIPSVVVGWWAAEPLLFGGFFGDAIRVLPGHDSLAHLRGEWHGAAAFALHGFVVLPVWLALAGAAGATYIYLFNPGLADRIRDALKPAYRTLDKKYWFDEFYQNIVAAAGRGIGRAMWKGGDETVIDGIAVNGSARSVGWLSALVRRIQTGRLYNYAFAMILGLIVLLGTFVMIAP